MVMYISFIIRGGGLEFYVSVASFKCHKKLLIHFSMVNVGRSAQKHRVRVLFTAVCRVGGCEGVDFR